MYAGGEQCPWHGPLSAGAVLRRETAPRGRGSWNLSSPTSRRSSRRGRGSPAGIRARTGSAPPPSRRFRRRARLVAGSSRPSAKRVVVREHAVGLRRVRARTPGSRSSARRCRSAGLPPPHTGERSVAPCEPVRTRVQLGEREMRRRWRDAAGVHDGGPDVVDQLFAGSAAGSRGSMLNTSPTASGVVVCCRISRKPSWSSAGTGSSIQNRSYGSSAARAAPPRSASAGGGRRAAGGRRGRLLAQRARTAGHEAQVLLGAPQLPPAAAPRSAGS